MRGFIADGFRDMPDFEAKKILLTVDLVVVRHEINSLLKNKLTDSNADMLHPELDRILPGTSSTS